MLPTVSCFLSCFMGQICEPDLSVGTSCGHFIEFPLCLCAWVLDGDARVVSTYICVLFGVPASNASYAHACFDADCCMLVDDVSYVRGRFETSEVFVYLVIVHALLLVSQSTSCCVFVVVSVLLCFQSSSRACDVYDCVQSAICWSEFACVKSGRSCDERGAEYAMLQQRLKDELCCS